MLVGNGEFIRYGFYDTGNTARYVDTSSLTGANGVWHHIAGVFDDSANTITIYWDGVQVGQTPSITQTPKSNTSTLWIGALFVNPTYSFQFKGGIDANIVVQTAVPSNTIYRIASKGRQ